MWGRTSAHGAEGGEERGNEEALPVAVAKAAAGAAVSLPTPCPGINMSGLNKMELEGCRDLLGLMETSEIFALCDTITNRLVQPQDRQDAIRAVLAYSQSAEELLKRKKVYREIIFKYLAMKGVIVPPGSEKHSLIQYAKNHWNKPELKVVEETVESVPNTEDTILFEQEKKEKKHEQFDDCYKLGEEFCQWFFELLNSQNPFFGPPLEKWGPQHFWDDVKLKFCYNTSEQSVIDYHGSELVSLRLLSLVKEEFLFLNPNLDCSGLKCVSSPHGLVIVAVAGTVHRGNMCLGIFEQVFGLIRSPFLVNTWKIKFINLRIVGQNSLEPGMTLEKPSITLESNELESLYNGNGTCSRIEALVTETPVLYGGSGNQALCHENEASLNTCELEIPNPPKH
ncbi:LOW QUALITY PROTEIN: uncharacterized protein C3orf38 homolog [Phascolarctos cinereus]|uniref:LOW QUALITY PROTEIN: uncharacterized protein C3orf38 homolog n=1 Tax=Phascolarctos cinereus TaxID=38626 RepID=A0A6P5J851_PHACI|nr:LOW QUALITY PROTEIN: uncharacterized protein C3orf38 homolog [Phascolarctos cinereus]